MENELEKVLENKFYCPNKFAQEIEDLVLTHGDMNYIDAIVYFCEKNSLDVESIPKLISKPLKEKIKYEATELNFSQKDISCQISILIPFWGVKFPGKKLPLLLFLKMTPFDCYKTYLALKNHFTKDSYDYYKYCKKTRASLESFYKRRDRFWFEKISRQRTDKEIEDFFISNFVSCNDSESLWIGEIIKTGDQNYNEWQRKIQSLSYLFKEECESLFAEYNFKKVFECSKGHPPLLKKFLSGKLSLETMVICDKIFLYGNDFDKKLKDPVWETVSRRIKKYSPFLHIDVSHYKKILKDIVFGGK